MRFVTSVFVLVLAGSARLMGGEAISPETLLPAHEATDASRPAIAFGPSTGSGHGSDVYMLAWQTGRNERADIVALRLDKSGKPLDEKPFVVCAAADCQERPRVAFGPSTSPGHGGGVFLVVWHDLRNGKDWDVYAARVSPEGKVLDADGIAVATGARNQCEPGLCWDGKAFQVLWRGYRGAAEDAVGVGRPPAAGYHVYGGRVSAEGKLLDGEPVLMAVPVRERLTPQSMGMAAVVPLADGRLLAEARSGMNVCLWRIADGKPLGNPALAPGASGFDDGAFATNGKTVLLTWTTFRDGGGRSSGVDKSGMLLLGADGEVGPATPQSLSSVTPAPRVRHPAPAWDGRRYVVAWDVPQRGKTFSHECVLMRCFGPDGKPLGNDEPIVDDPESPAYRPALASDGAGTTVMAYERHPRTADAPIRIGLRVIRAEQ